MTDLLIERSLGDPRLGRQTAERARIGRAAIDPLLAQGGERLARGDDAVEMIAY